jgi:hypothetical protein
MSYHHDELRPWPAQKAGDWKSIRTRAPLTPFFFGDEVGTITKVTRVFSGGGFFPQNHRTKLTASSEVEAICGHQMFQTWTGDYSEDGFWKPAPNSPCTAYSGSKTVTRTRTMTFNETANTVSIVWAEDIEQSGSGIGGFPENTKTLTATTVTMSYDWERSPTSCERFHREGTETLSNAVTSGVIDGWLSEWMGKSFTFRNATNEAVVDAQAGFNSCATRAESSGARYYKVSGGQAKTRGTWFLDGWSSGTVGSLANLWNGNYTVMLCLRRRMNRPTIYREPTKVPNGYGGFTVNTGLNFANYGIYTKVSYPNGVVEEELEDETTNHWSLYGGGEFEWNPDSSPDPVFAATPWRPIGYLYGFQTFASPSYVYLSQLNLISRTGRRYRITIQLGEWQYDEETWEGSMNWHTEHVLETDPESLRVQFRLELDSDAQFTEARIFRLEQWTGIEPEPWKVIAEAEHEILPDPATMISDKVTVPGIHLLAATQERNGSAFGFSSFDWESTTRYRKRSFRSNRTTPEAGNPGISGCGGAYPQGSATYEYSEEYVEGELRPPQVIAHSLQVGGVDWTNPDYVPYEHQSLPGAWPTEMISPTLRRATNSGDSEDYGHSGPMLDTPDPDGRVLETIYVPLPVSAVGNQNVTDWTDLMPPAAGSSVFVEGQRLTYSAQT